MEEQYEDMVGSDTVKVMTVVMAVLVAGLLTHVLTKWGKSWWFAVLVFVCVVLGLILWCLK